jgi:hypothetical protein
MNRALLLPIISMLTAIVLIVIASVSEYDINLPTIIISVFIGLFASSMSNCIQTAAFDTNSKLDYSS